MDLRAGPFLFRAQVGRLRALHRSRIDARIVTRYKAAMAMYNPPHPGELLREDVLPELKLSVTDFANHMQMSRVSISRVLNGKAGISPDFAVRLEKAGIGRARIWLGIQADYELWQAEHREQPAIEPLQAASGLKKAVRDD